MITLDGSHGEGGGQILRTALALSMITQKPFKIKNIRKNRPKPGLNAQHLTGVKALQALSDSKVVGAKIGSLSLEFSPKPLTKFKAEINVGTAGAVTLVMQTILPVLVTQEKTSRLKIIGGTDVSWSPPIDYFLNVKLPQLTRYADIKASIERRGHFPKGGGVIELVIKPKENKEKIVLTKNEELFQIKGISHATKDLVNAEVAERQARAAKLTLNKLGVPITIATTYVESLSTGSGIVLWALHGKDGEINLTNPVVLGAVCLGKKGKKSEVIGEHAAKKLLEEINSEACADEHLTDNLIPFLGLYGGEIKTSKITWHTKSNIYVTEQFLDVKFEIDEENNVITVHH